MPSDVSRAHHLAVYGLLATVGAQRYFGKVDVPDSELVYPYLIVWPVPATRNQINLAGNLSDAVTISQVTAVGRDVDEVLATLDRAAAALHGVRPVIAGRLPGLIRQQPGNQPVVPDTSVSSDDGQPTYMSASFFALTSTAAPAS